MRPKTIGPSSDMLSAIKHETPACTERERHLMMKAVKRLEASWVYDKQKGEDPSQKLIEK
ncbi:hypothetical protein Bca4012_096360 [Brassica carinata]|uniref:(rape) hypothetical protein n=1 Tax=Brassica napus TaxID=3708 RepID=A0A816UIB9_BRANA|nr:unnamed protein product [Brassica napus]